MPDTPDLAELTELQRQMHGYFDTLVAAGMPEAVVTTAAMVAIGERLLHVATPTQAAAFYRGHALNMERNGPAMKAALRRA